MQEMLEKILFTRLLATSLLYSINKKSEPENIEKVYIVQVTVYSLSIIILYT